MSVLIKRSRRHFKLLILTASALSLLFPGCFHNPADSQVAGDQYQLFAMVWEDYEANYPEFTLKGVNWKELFYEYSPLAEQAETTEELVMDVLLPMLSELHDVHIWFRDPGDDILPTYLKDVECNFNITVLIENYLWPAGFNGWVNDVGYCDPSILPYLAIRSWTLELNLERIEDFLELAKDKPAIIIDVRMNPGGNNSLTGEVAGAFTDSGVLGWMLRYRTGPGYDDVAYYHEYTVPNANLDYDGIVYLLIGEKSASSTEDFALRMMNLDNVVMLGDTTMGFACCPREVQLSDGWRVNTIAWSSRTSDYEPVEDHGIAPDIYVEATEEDFAQGIDPVLEYAIELVNSQQ